MALKMSNPTKELYSRIIEQVTKQSHIEKHVIAMEINETLPDKEIIKKAQAAANITLRKYSPPFTARYEEMSQKMVIFPVAKMDVYWARQTGRRIITRGCLDI